MSPLWRDEIGVYLGPHRLALTRLGRGLRPKCRGTAEWTNDDAADTHWAATLKALDGFLAKAQWRGAVARMVVSDHWARYAMVPYAASLGSAAERLTHARHVLTGIYGEVVGRWAVALADGRPGVPQVASALPAALLEELQAMLLRHRVALRSLQPQLVCAYNHWRAQLPNGGAWFVSIEKGSLAAARLSVGGWDRVHSVRIAADWALELRRLQTFGRLAGKQAEAGRVFVDAPVGLRLARAAGAANLVWLEEPEPGESTIGRLEYLRRQLA